ncbi:MAG: DNA-directed DNA polymerase [Aigarchaeota archaeon]|nr:DNA-directed DNA polymerase [Aigarchaeota archaeon]
MRLRLWLLDVVSEQETAEPLLWLWCKDENGATWVVKQRYVPSFYLVGDLKGAEPTLESENLRWEHCERRIRGRPVEAIRVYVESGDSEKVAERLAKRAGGRTGVYEEDIRPAVKYFLETGVKPCSWIEVEGEHVGDGEGVSFFEAEAVDALEPSPPPKLSVAAVDFLFFSEKGSAKPERDPIRLISVCFNDGEKLQFEGGEAEIITSFSEAVRRRDPDVIVGFGLNRVQWSYFEERSRRIGVKPLVGRLEAEPRTSLHGHVSIRGRLNIDLDDMAREIPELTVETLEEFIEYLGIEMPIDIIGEYELADKWAKDEETVKRYSMQRAEAILRAYEAVKDFIFSLSELTSMPADYVLTASAGFRVENYLMALAVKVGELIPKRTEIPHISYPGGLVKAPSPGIHENVAVLDFRSMYPSLMIKYNISFDTLSDEGENIAPNGYRFRSSPEGFLPHALKTLLEERRKIQEKLRQVPPDSVEARVLDARQRAVKTIANAIYGYTGWVGARWYTREVAEATTAWGREVISSTIKKAEELGMRVVYSDTDSLFLKDHEGKLGELIRWIEGDLGLEAKIDRIFKRVIFTEAKKRYAGITEEGAVEVVGLETVRGDWSEIAREAQRNALEALLRTGDPKKALEKAREYARMVKRGAVDLKKLVIWRQITRPLSEYAATQPHIVVAKIMIDEGWKIQPGDKVGYIVVKGPGPLHARVKPYFKVMRDEVDWNYYLEKQLAPACGRVLEAVGVNPELILETAGEPTLMEFLE